MHKLKTKVATPTVSPNKSGVYASPLRITVNCVSGAQVFYTLDGTRPTCSDRNVPASYSYSSLNGIVLARPGEYHLCVMAVCKGLEPSDPKTIIFTVTGSLSHAGVADLILEDTFRRHMELDRPHVGGVKSKAHAPSSTMSNTSSRTMKSTSPSSCYVLQDTHTAGSLRALIHSYHGTSTDLVLYRTATNLSSVTRVPTFQRVYPPNLNLRHALHLKEEPTVGVPSVVLDSARAKTSLATFYHKHAVSQSPYALNSTWDERMSQEEMDGAELNSFAGTVGSNTKSSFVTRKRAVHKASTTTKSNRCLSSLSTTHSNTLLQTFVFEQKAGLDNDEDEEESHEVLEKREQGMQLLMKDLRRHKIPKETSVERMASNILVPSFSLSSDVAGGDRIVMAFFTVLNSLKNSAFPTILTKVPYGVLHSVFQPYDDMTESDLVNALRESLDKALGKASKHALDVILHDDPISANTARSLDQPPPTYHGITQEQMTIIFKLGSRAKKPGQSHLGTQFVSAHFLLACARFFIGNGNDVSEAVLRFLRDIMVDLCQPSVENSSTTIARMDVATILDLYRRKRHYRKRVVNAIQKYILEPWDYKTPRMTYSAVEVIIKEHEELWKAFATDLDEMKLMPRLAMEAITNTSF
eukprot:PhF_6_TR11699/c0_g1_i1/m.19016